ncbi:MULTISPECIES: energy-coupling factor transporter transmembrane component T family protein [Fusobacterium]|jgi:energy-coupling factor transport system permease protein|uniref:Energy-coupling factor transporter transmembrane protein EcfT n=1 Tax=Fusobacterium varium ATCC 27725 TaxID=469618 RepID=A0ABN5JFI2_FUSVA|nr:MULTISPECIES: energy-coupling factor transporter transmembrane component T [Fusobacterium]AVQ30748.1 energy-coupling factor transporter transmembrane protein EcfT [Fusobacterium varium ATCC 27725]EES64174.1 cobalt transport protein [Fusobacterium varium ATCC 27725]RHG32725.1 energy-coupling factor transporter transmembrane protein EcfT [Fusobacterium varium]VEH40632.1 Putative HMP/thiamine permease protein YkoC [Fusobacterium varium]HBJ77804.1 energy-coupling factor transporter transmembran
MIKLNPGYKGLTIFLVSLLLSFEYNYYLNFSVFCICIMLMIINKISLKKILLAFLPVLFLAGGIFFTGMLYSSSGTAEDITSLTKTVVVIGNIENGLQLSIRILAYAGLGLLFVFTTDPRLFIISLMQQFHLPGNFAYGILAAYGFIPVIKQEYENMRYAYRARGVKRNIFMLPMLVTAVRSSESIAMAMESKGFNAKSSRTEYIKLKVTKWDYIILIGSVGITILTMYLF